MRQSELAGHKAAGVLQRARRRTSQWRHVRGCRSSGNLSWAVPQAQPELFWELPTLPAPQGIHSDHPEVHVQQLHRYTHMQVTCDDGGAGEAPSQLAPLIGFWGCGSGAQTSSDRSQSANTTCEHMYVCRKPSLRETQRKRALLEARETERRGRGWQGGSSLDNRLLATVASRSVLRPLGSWPVCVVSTREVWEVLGRLVQNLGGPRVAFGRPGGRCAGRAHGLARTWSPT